MHSSYGLDGKGEVEGDYREVHYDGGHALFARVHIVRGELPTSKGYAGDHEQEVAESMEQGCATKAMRAEDHRAQNHREESRLDHLERRLGRHKRSGEVL